MARTRDEIEESRRQQRLRDLVVMFRASGERSPLYPAIKFSCASRDPCDASRRLDGALLVDHPELPLTGCDQHICLCHWRLVPGAEYRRLQK